MVCVRKLLLRYTHLRNGLRTKITLRYTHLRNGLRTLHFVLRKSQQ